MYDVLVIGGGVTGCSIARELSRYRLKTAVAEREEDVCSGTSKANSGIVHGSWISPSGRTVRWCFALTGSSWGSCRH